MQSKWFSNCASEEDKREMRVRLAASAPILERLREIIIAKQVSATNTEPADYDSPSWAYKQAHLNGYNEAIREVLKYIDITD